MVETPFNVDITVAAPPGWRRYTGLQYAVSSGSNLGAPSNILPGSIASESTMLGYGVKGWNRFKPTSRNGSLAQAVIELRDIPRMLEHSTRAGMMRERHRGFLHLTGAQFLNIEFGWLPFLADVRDLVRNAILAQKRLDQLIRDNNKWIRRRGTVTQTAYPDLTQTQHEQGIGNYTTPGFDTYFIRMNERYSSRWFQQRAWFSARFKYHIMAPQAGRLSKFLLAEHVNRILYGTDISPSLLWQLVPWSWLVDWFSSAGASIANFFEDQSDNLVADYAYVMYSTLEHRTTRSVCHLLDGNTYEATLDQVYETKQRREATPYGFYLVPPSLSAKQIGILVALGLTRRVYHR